MSPVNVCCRWRGKNENFEMPRFCERLLAVNFTQCEMRGLLEQRVGPQRSRNSQSSFVGWLHIQCFQICFQPATIVCNAGLPLPVLPCGNTALRSVRAIKVAACARFRIVLTNRSNNCLSLWLPWRIQATKGKGRNTSSEKGKIY